MASRYIGTIGEHDLLLEWHRWPLFELAVLLVDGQRAATRLTSYGTKTMSVRLADGTDVTVRVMCGRRGELRLPQLSLSGGTWLDLDELSL